MIVEGKNQGRYYPDYAYHHPLFSEAGKPVSDSTVSNFLADVTNDQITGFLDDWNADRDHSSRIYVSYDSTNKNCQAGDIDFVEFGKAKDEKGLPIFNVSVAFDKTNQVPLFYEQYPGSINDVSQFRYFVDKAMAYNYRNIGFILDRGYFSKDNIRYMDEKGYSFVMMVKGCKKLVSSLIDQHRCSFEYRRDCTLWRHHVHGTTIQGKLFAEDEKERYFHLYFSAEKMAQERQQFEEKLAQIAQFLHDCEGKAIVFDKPYTTYFELFYDDRGQLCFAKEKTDVTELELLRCGYFCIVTSDKMSAQEAYALYKGRDSSEKLFSSDKSFLGSRSMRVQTKEAVSTKILIEFVALIVRNRIYNLLKEQMLKLPVKKNYLTVPAAIRELEKIEIVRINNTRYQLDNAITRTQQVILSSFGISEDNVKSSVKALATKLAKNAEVVTEDNEQDEEDSDDAQA